MNDLTEISDINLSHSSSDPGRGSASLVTGQPGYYVNIFAISVAGPIRSKRYATEMVVYQVESDDQSGANVPTLVPGNGWGSIPNIQTPFQTVGAPIANWDVARYKDIRAGADGFFQLGILAFHNSGIEKVEIAVDGGDSVEAVLVRNAETTYSGWPNEGDHVSPATTEYTVKLQPELFALPNDSAPFAKLVELRAKITAKNGMTRILRDLKLNVIRGDLVDPVEQTGNIGAAVDALASAMNGDVGGGVIALPPGTYNVPAKTVFTGDRYLTITSAPGVDPSDVKIVSFDGQGINTNRIRFLSLTMYAAPFVGTPSDSKSILYEKCHLKADDDTGLLYQVRWTHQNWPQRDFIGFLDNEISHNILGPTTGDFHRGNYIHHIGEDIFRYPKMVVNNKVRNNGRCELIPGAVHDSTCISPARCDSDFHSDLFEITASYPDDNVIIAYTDVKNTSTQGFYTANNYLTNYALVNLVIEKNIEDFSESPYCKSWCNKFFGDDYCIEDHLNYCQIGFPSDLSCDANGTQFPIPACIPYDWNDPNSLLYPKRGAGCGFNGNLSQIAQGGRIDNLIILDSTFADQTFRVRTDDNRDFTIRNSVFNSFTGMNSVNGYLDLNNNHCRADGKKWDSVAQEYTYNECYYSPFFTTGDPSNLWVDPLADDYHPGAGSGMATLRDRVQSPPEQVTFSDIEGTIRTIPGAIGAYEQQ
jgi:hypothetical protein